MVFGVILLAAVVTGSAFAAQQTTEGAETAAIVTQDSSAVDPAPLEVLNWVYLGAGAAAVGLFFWRRWYRWGAVRSQLSTLSPVAGLAMGMVMLGLGRLGAQAAGWLFGIDLTSADGAAMSLADSGRLQLGSYAAQGIILAAFVWLVVRAKRSARARRYGIPRAALIGVVALLLFWPIVNCVAFAAGFVIEVLTGKAPDPIGHTLLAQLVESPVDVWLYLTIALVVVGAPVYEEVLYRGIVQQALVGAGMRRWPAILTTSVLFTLVHLGAVSSVDGLLALFVLSIGFGWVYEKTGRLSASIVMHAAFNLTNLLLAWLTVGTGS
ncbi:MAG: CPBP family intramembrane metalloprotease [Planctomycetes bacterium]|nr:CPBP family intramembrane metalloprotease [Planctomycetota bacterium]